MTAIFFECLQWRFLRKSPSFSAVFSSAHFALEKGMIKDRSFYEIFSKFVIWYILGFEPTFIFLLVVLCLTFTKKIFYKKTDRWEKGWEWRSGQQDRDSGHHHHSLLHLSSHPHLPGLQTLPSYSLVNRKL